jgi:formate/nitrite transporter FocA (FNT family)
MNLKDYLPSRQTIVGNVIGAIIAAVLISRISALRALTKD